MEYTQLGRSGLTVSRICLGCMGFGDPTRGEFPWTLAEAESRRFIEDALDAGITFFDTANLYSQGTSEEFLGRALLSTTRREEVTIATKVWGYMGPGTNGQGLSRGAIMTQVDASLRRLGTDYIDLYIVHRTDPLTPWEETLQALDDLIRVGKVRYIGASAMHAWEFAKALFLADMHGWTRFITAQVALAWLLSKPGVVSPVVGTTKPPHLFDALAGADLRLEASEIAELEACYQPHAFKSI